MDASVNPATYVDRFVGVETPTNRANSEEFALPSNPMRGLETVGLQMRALNSDREVDFDRCRLVV